MKILYLKLKNSIGIWAGLSKTSIELNFNNPNSNSVVMLFGKNGSGKSVILSSLHPFTGSVNDDRSKFFIEGKEGFKEIHYQVDKKVYLIRHYISKGKTKSFLSVMSLSKYNKFNPDEAFNNAEELNENGGVRTFNELVKQYLDVDEEFFKISRIGSNVTNFIDLSTTNRKKYISMFLPNIDEYLTKYKIVNEKHRLLNKEIKYISDEILKIGNIDDLNSQLALLKTNIKQNKERIDLLTENISEAKGQLKIYLSDSLIDPEDYSVNKFSFNTNRYNKKVEKFKISTINDIENIIEKENSMISKLSNQYDKLSLKLASIKESVNDKSSLIKSKESSLKELSSEDIDELKKLIDNYNQDLEDIKEENESIDLSIYSDNFIENIDEYKDSINEIKIAISDCKKKASIEIQEILLNEFDRIPSKYEKYKEKYEKYSKLYTELDKELLEIESKEKYLDILKKRPEDCFNNSCQFIKTALKYSNILEIRDKHIERMNKISQLKDKYLAKKELYSNVNDIYNIIKSKFNNNKDKFKYYPFKFKINKPLDLVTLLLTNKTNFNNFKVNDIILYSTNLYNIEKLEDKINSIKEKIKLNSQISKMSDSLNKEINELKESIITLKEEYSEINIECNKISEEIDNCKEYIEELEEFKNECKKYEEYKENYEKAEELINKISKLMEDTMEYKKERTKLKEVLSDQEEQYENYRLKESKLKEFNERKSKLDLDFENLTYLKDALNPTKGIPVYFIQNYLDKTKLITNELLDISQKGKFAISFDITDKDFFIKVYKDNGDILNDINLASQGEKSLTSLSLSLALMQQSVSKYNIILLDEIDGPLDTKNRSSFINMVETQMNNLNSEQVFIISHNHEFDSYPIDMILLKDHDVNINDNEFMENKNIIYTV